MDVRIGLLGPVVAWRGVEGDEGTAAEIALPGPRHREVLARLALAGGRVVPVDVLVEDLWTAPPAGAVTAVRTFVAALRRALEPDRPARAPARTLVTVGAGYALRAATDVDASRVPADADVPTLEGALALWRGPALDGLGQTPWVRAERDRLTGERLRVVELLAAARLRSANPGSAVPDLLRHTEENPWREEGWRLLALALAAAGRRAEALDVLRSARSLLVGELGLDPGPGLREAEATVLADGPGVRWEASVDALRHLAVTGAEGLRAARSGRSAALDAFEAGGAPTPRTAARVVGGFDVPALWWRSDDPAQAARVVAAAEHLLRAGPGEPGRARLLATLAVERRGVGGSAAPAAEAERLARRLGDPTLLVHALGARYLAGFEDGTTADRRRTGEELVAVSARHELWAHEVLGHLVVAHTACATADLVTADRHVRAARDLAAAEGAPLVEVFTGWYGALREALDGARFETVLAGYRRQVEATRGQGMPGLEEGLLEVAVAAAHLQHGRAVPGACAAGPFAAWTGPLALLGSGDREAARTALRAAGEPPPGHFADLFRCFLAAAAAELRDDVVSARLLPRLEPVADEFAGAGSGMVTAGPVAGFVDRLRDLTG
ncbi:BTAD domain-containing putative transcriptional regulator [Kineococcus sp. TBRC 1896]|uniref:BTAD domain-containing putative transcriptional regulator n=1 Tax=Kineococcus mangrovi TaxID=1660183 RepID=A0ABV4I2Q8_9ACTN